MQDEPVCRCVAARLQDRQDLCLQRPDTRVAVGRVCAVYCVFDGHKDDTATAYLERHLGRNLEHEFRMLEARTRSGEEARGREGNGEDGEDTVERAMRRAILRTESEYGMSNATGCFFCHGPAPEGGSTVNVVAIQRVVSGRGDDALAFDAVTANVGDSAALMLPHQQEPSPQPALPLPQPMQQVKLAQPLQPMQSLHLAQPPQPPQQLQPLQPWQPWQLPQALQPWQPTQPQQRRSCRCRAG